MIDKIESFAQVKGTAINRSVIGQVLCNNTFDKASAQQRGHALFKPKLQVTSKKKFRELEENDPLQNVTKRWYMCDTTIVITNRGLFMALRYGNYKAVPK